MQYNTIQLCSSFEHQAVRRQGIHGLTQGSTFYVVEGKWHGSTGILVSVVDVNQVMRKRNASDI